MSTFSTTQHAFTQRALILISSAGFYYKRNLFQLHTDCGGGSGARGRDGQALGRPLPAGSAVAYLAQNQAQAKDDARGAHLIVRGCWVGGREPEKIRKASKNHAVFSSRFIK